MLPTSLRLVMGTFRFRLFSVTRPLTRAYGSYSGPNHSDNFFFVYGENFNESIGARHDEFNCYLAGLKRTERVVKVALQVSQDYTLRNHLDKNDRPFHDSQLFRRVSYGEVSRRGYLRGRAPPGHRGNLVSSIGATSPTQGPNAEHDPLQSPGTGTPKVCGKHSAGVNLYPTTNDDYDSGPERCKAMTSKGTQCKTGQKRGARMQSGLRTATRSVLPGRTPLCGIHLRSGNLALYPSANSDYDGNPATCKAMVENGENRGKQCSKPRKN